MSSWRPSDLRFLLGLLLPALTLWSVLRNPAHAAVGAALVWGFIAVTEALVPALRRSPAGAGPQPALAWILRGFVPLEILLLLAAGAAAGQGDLPTILGLAFAVGFVTGAQGITFAHELGHSRRRLDRALAWVLMGCVLYGHFMVEHYRGHHVRAATHDDPASARPGESLWRFLPRTLAGSWVHAWQLESEFLRMRRRGWVRSPLLWCTASGAVVLAALAAAGWWNVLLFWVLQSAFAVWLLETVNYIEHYGLQRRFGADGRPEPFATEHAWNADTLLSNSLLANLQRHSDHHVHAWKPYPELEALPGPQLPTGYAGCILLAALPPVWFAFMHPRLGTLEVAEK
ncbi:MAG: Alkane monooxygenase (Alkane omega-hydroxylase) [Ramlibacter sp.]|jgi:alkane 1-monooxygenase|nr:Alkane monooxygenase (Alkane omega-hydroxylase) [Ramlibacter sp.]